MRYLIKAILVGTGVLATVGFANAQTGNFSSGTGFFINDKGSIVTNAHVVKGCQTILVKSRELGVYSASVITADAKNDIAVLKLENFDKKSAYPALNFRARLGESSYVFGYPLTGVLSDTGNFTAGSVSSLQGIANDSSKLQISTPVQPGNSGGPVLDDKGNLIGVVVSKLDALKNIAETKDIAQNVNFAIKSQVLDGVLQAINIANNIPPNSQIKQPVDIADIAQNISVHIICRVSEQNKSLQSTNEPKKSYTPPPNSGQKTGPVLLGTFGEWGAYAADASGKGRVCYVLGKPKERVPYELKRDAGFIFISTRPAEGVYGEISFVLGFPTTDGSVGTLTIGNLTWQLSTRGTSAWLKNASDDRNVIEAIKKNSVMHTSVSTAKGNISNDRYVLSGFEQALYRIKKECP